MFLTLNVWQIFYQNAIMTRILTSISLLTPFFRYEQEMARPIRSLVTGDLPRALLIQVRTTSHILWISLIFWVGALKTCYASIPPLKFFSQPSFDWVIYTRELSLACYWRFFCSDGAYKSSSLLKIKKYSPIQNKAPLSVLMLIVMRDRQG